MVVTWKWSSYAPTPIVSFPVDGLGTRLTHAISQHNVSVITILRSIIKALEHSIIVFEHNSPRPSPHHTQYSVRTKFHGTVNPPPRPLPPQLISLLLSLILLWPKRKQHVYYPDDNESCKFYNKIEVARHC